MPAIKIDPALLMSQSAEMTSLTEEFDALFASVSSRLTAMNGQWSANLANNFGTKIQSAGSAFTMLKALLQGGAESARLSAETFKSVDDSIGLTMQSNGSGIWKQVWGDTINQIKDSWKTTGEVSKWIEERINNLPDEYKKIIEEGMPEGVAIVKIISDITNGEIGLDTLSDYLKAIGEKSTKITAITSVISHVVDENGYVQEMVDYNYKYQQLAAQNILEGNIQEALKNLGMSFICSGAAAMDTLAEGISEVSATLIDGALGKGIAAIKTIGHIVPGPIGDTITKIGNTADDLTSGLVSWIRGWF